MDSTKIKVVIPSEKREGPLLTHISDGDRKAWWDNFNAELLFRVSCAKSAEKDQIGLKLEKR